MNCKYIILDFGKVLAAPTTGDWFITPKFKEKVDMNLIDKEKLNYAFNKYEDIISRKMQTEEEEYNNFFELYSLVLQEIGYRKYSEDIAHEIAYNFTYKQDKYTFYEGIKEELCNLKKKYKLILLTDNWPCIERILKENKLYKYFEKIYISSEYGTIKKQGSFFNYPINEFNIKKHEALFIDDNEENLKVGKEKGLDVLLMDREHKINKSEFKIIDNLYNI